MRQRKLAEPLYAKLAEMEFKSILISQYRAELKMLADCISLFSDEAWAAGDHPRSAWRIAYHALFYTHLYLAPDAQSFKEWHRHVSHGPVLWLDDEEGVPPVEVTFSQADLLEYLDFVSENLTGWVENLDLQSSSSGFSWYPNMSKLEHQMVNLRHLGVHIGQLQERLYADGLEPGWKSRG